MRIVSELDKNDFYTQKCVTTVILHPSLHLLSRYCTQATLFIHNTWNVNVIYFWHLKIFTYQFWQRKTNLKEMDALAAYGAKNKKISLGGSTVWVHAKQGWMQHISVRAVQETDVQRFQKICFHSAAHTTDRNSNTHRHLARGWTRPLRVMYMELIVRGSWQVNVSNHLQR